MDLVSILTEESSLDIYSRYDDANDKKQHEDWDGNEDAQSGLGRYPITDC